MTGMVITARIRRMGEGTVFSLSVHTSIGGGGYPIQGLDGARGYPIPDLDGWGTLSQVQMGGGLPLPRSRWGNPHPSRSRRGGGSYPLPGPDGGGGYLLLLTGGVPPSMIRMGGTPEYPPHPELDGVHPPHQHSEHLLHGG